MEDEDLIPIPESSCRRAVVDTLSSHSSAEDREFRRKVNASDHPDRDFEKQARKYHRGGQPQTTEEKRAVTDSVES